MNWKNAGSTKAVNSSAFLELLVLPPQRWHSTLNLLPSEVPFNNSKGLLERKSGFAIQKNRRCQIHFGRASRWPSLQKYQQKGKLLQWQVHLSLKDWRRWFHWFHWWRQQKASLNAGSMFAFFFFWHLIRKLQGLVWSSWRCRDISSRLNNDQKAWRSFLWLI